MKWGIATGLTVSLPAMGKSPTSSHAANHPTAGISQSTLNALVDTLIPADILTPSASELGIASILLKQAEGDTAFRPWLTEGLKWLDQGTAGSFAQRDESARASLLEQLAATAPGTQTRTFFELVRVRVMSAYYADPRSRVGLAIARPPQPLGYPDFAGPNK